MHPWHALQESQRTSIIENMGNSTGLSKMFHAVYSWKAAWCISDGRGLAGVRWRPIFHYWSAYVYEYKNIHKYIPPRQDLYFSIWLTFLALKWSHLLQKGWWSLRTCFLKLAPPVSIELFPFNKTSTHPFLIKFCFAENLPFSKKLLICLSISTPVWYDPSAALIKVFLNKNHPFSIEPIL